MKFERDDTFGCELAQGRVDRDGYCFWGSTRAHTHRYVEAHGPVPDGLVLDHGCRRRNCCALIHLEAVTPSENERRKKLSYRLKRSRCMNGHDMDENRAVTPEGGVVCRACARGENTNEGATR